MIHECDVGHGPPTGFQLLSPLFIRKECVVIRTARDREACLSVTRRCPVFTHASQLPPLCSIPAKAAPGSLLNCAISG